MADDTPKPKSKRGGARPGAGRASGKVRDNILSLLDDLNYSPLKNLVKAANDARLQAVDPNADKDDKRFYTKLAADIDKDILSYQIPKPKAKQEIAVTANPVKELLEEIWSEEGKGPE